MQRFFVRLTTNPEPIIIIIVETKRDEWTGGAKRTRFRVLYLDFDCIPTRIEISRVDRIIHPAMRSSIVLYFPVNNSTTRMYVAVCF